MKGEPKERSCSKAWAPCIWRVILAMPLAKECARHLFFQLGSPLIVMGAPSAERERAGAVEAAPWED